MLRSVYIILMCSILVSFTACGSHSASDDITVISFDTKDAHISVSKKIFLIGDSTVFNVEGKKRGWGNFLDTYMKSPDNLHNLARGGSSSKSYKEPTEWRDWGKTKEKILELNSTANSYLLIQFGANDIAESEEEAKDEHTIKTMPGRYESYYRELKVYIDWARAHDVTPVLLTSLQEMKKDLGAPLHNVLKKSFGDYGETVRELAKDENVLLLDLAKKSYSIFNKYANKDEIVRDFGVIGANDYTHFGEKGARTVSSWVKELICSSKDKVLCAQFK